MLKMVALSDNTDEMKEKDIILGSKCSCWYSRSANHMISTS